MRKQFPVLEVENRIDVLYFVFRKDVVLLGICCFDRLRTRRYRWAGVRPGEIHQRGVEDVDHWKEDQVKRLFRGFDREQVVNVSDTDFSREAWIDGSAAGTSAVKFGTGVIGIDKI